MTLQLREGFRSIEELLLFLRKLRKRGYFVTLRGDAAFAISKLYDALEAQKINYVIELPSSSDLDRFVARLARRMQDAEKSNSYRFIQFRYRHDSWSRKRKVIARLALREESPRDYDDYGDEEYDVYDNSTNTGVTRKLEKSFFVTNTAWAPKIAVRTWNPVGEQTEVQTSENVLGQAWVSWRPKPKRWSESPVENARSIQRFPVISGKFVDVSFAEPRDRKRILGAVRQWKKAVRREGNPIKRDAVELAELAVRRWCEALAELRVAKTLKDLREHVRDNPHTEVSILLIAETSWLTARGRRIVGLSHIRRTWCNHLVIDFLAIDPSIAGDRDSPFGGLGSGLIYAIAKIACDVKAALVWAETTQNSVPFYEKIFKRENLLDLLLVGESDYLLFQDRLKTIWDTSVGETRDVSKRT